MQQPTESPATMTCVLLVKTGLPGWQKSLMNVFDNIQGLAFSLDVPHMLLHMSGKVDPLVMVKKLQKAKTHVFTHRIDYGYEENPQAIRQPTTNLMSCTFDLNTQEDGWYKKIEEALKSIQGVSFTIDAASKMGYISGRIDTGLLMKMIEKTTIVVYRIDYGFDPKKVNPNPSSEKGPPSNDKREAMAAKEAPVVETKTRATNQPETSIITSGNRSKSKKTNAFKRFLLSRFRFL